MNCSDCVSGDWLPGSPKGTEENGTYFAKGSDQESTQDKAVVVFTDIFGLSISNPKIIADTIAERTGFDVWVPDLFNGVSSTASGVRTIHAHPIPVVQDTHRLHLRHLTPSFPAIRVKRLGSGGRSGCA